MIKNYVKFQHDGAYGGMEYENFEVYHLRLLSDSNFLPYGRSQIEPARRVWKQLSLMEDPMLINRIESSRDVSFILILVIFHLMR